MSLEQKVREILEKDSYSSPQWALEEIPGTEIVQDEITGQGRWSTYHRMVVKYEDQFWAIDYDQGSTEYQESSGDITFQEVVPQEVTVVNYVRK